MNELTLIHHSGWPWPLDTVQNWFEGLWDQIRGWIEGVARAVWDIMPKPFKDFVGFLQDLTSEIWKALLAFFKDPIGTLKSAFDTLGIFIRDIVGWWDPAQKRFVGGFLGWLWDSVTWLWGEIVAVAGAVWDLVSPVLTNIWNAVKDFGSWLWDQIQVGLGWLRGVIWGWIEGALKWLTDCFRWLQGEISGAADWIITGVTTAFDGAVAGITTSIAEALAGLGAALGEAFKGVVDWFWETLVPALGRVADFLKEHVLLPIWGGLTWLWDWIVARATDAFHAVEDLFKGFSSITPEQAFNLAPKVLVAAAGLGLAATGITSVAGIKVMGTGLEVGEIGSYIRDLISPGMFVGATIGTLIGVGLTTPLRYYYQKIFRPLIPPIPDLIRFVVREVIPPETFYDLAGYHGYTEERATWYWDAHWVLPAYANVVDAFHRGLISEEELQKFLVWHDYSPEPRPGIEKTDVEIMRGLLKTLIPRVDLRYAWELGRLTDEELVAWYEQLGYEEDSPLMAEIQIARALVDEIHKIRDEWIRYHIEGFIDSETLRANLAEIGIGPARIDYYVIYAQKRREREAKKDWLDIYDDAYIKDLITEDELESRAREILVEPEAIAIYLERAYIRKYKRPTPPKPERVRVATLAYLTTAFREAIITEDELRAELERRLYTPEDIETIISVEIMKRMKAAGE